MKPREAVQGARLMRSSETEGGSLSRKEIEELPDQDIVEGKEGMCEGNTMAMPPFHNKGTPEG